MSGPSGGCYTLEHSVSLTMNAINKRKKGALGVVWKETEVLGTRLYNNAVTAAGTGVFTTDLIVNSAFNPLGSLSAVQPARYDQFDAMYRKSLVTRAKYRLTFAGANTSATYSFVAAVYPYFVTGSPVTPATFQAAASIPGAKTIEWVPGSKSVVLEFDMDIANVLGHPLTDGCYGVGASPSILLRLGVYMQTAAAATQTIMWSIDAQQQTVFCERKYVVDA